MYCELAPGIRAGLGMADIFQKHSCVEEEATAVPSFATNTATHMKTPEENLPGSQTPERVKKCINQRKELENFSQPQTVLISVGNERMTWAGHTYMCIYAYIHVLINAYTQRHKCMSFYNVLIILFLDFLSCVLCVCMHVSICVYVYACVVCVCMFVCV